MEYLHHGTLAVPRGLEHAYEAARAYLCRDPHERVLFDRVEHDRFGRSFRLRENHRNNDYFNPNTDTIGWDPYSALRTTGGGRQSPALGLGHELDHAAEAPWIADRLRKHREGRYDDAEERRVIEGSERHAARVLGEDARHDHRGTCYRVSSPVLR